MYKILACDDERDIVSALRIYLTSDGYQVFEAYSGIQALEVLQKEDIHLVLLDVMMPQMDGLTALARVRQVSNVPVILLTAKSEDTDKILGLNVGADDYVTKPFNPVELLARVRSQLRRYLQLGGGQVRPSQIVIGSIALDDDAKAVTLDGFPHAAGIRHSEAADAEFRHGIRAEGDLPPHLGRRALRRGECGGGTYPPSARKAGDQSGRPALSEGGLGTGL